MATREASARPSASSEATFEERALGGGGSPLERIDHLFHQTSKLLWLGVMGLVVLVVAGVIWAAVAEETVTVTSPAVIVPIEGVYNVGQTQSGEITGVLVEPGAVVEEGETLAELRSELDSQRTILIGSPIAGTVLTVDVRVGDVTQPGSTMFRLAPLNRDPVAIALIPAVAMNDLEVGQPAAVTVNGVSADRFGTVRGRVASIGPIPASEQRLQQITGDNSLLSLTAEVGPVREVVIELTAADTPSGLAWSRGDGPASPLSVGVNAFVEVTVDRQALIEKAFS